ncbi:hypothetical protein Agub_g177, partial [Astrephomene gubernaculifera]
RITKMATLQAPTASFAKTCTDGARRGVAARITFRGTPISHSAPISAPASQNSLRVASRNRSSPQVAASSTPGPSPQSTQAPEGPQTRWLQKTVVLPPYPRGCHVITRRIYEMVPELAAFEVGLAHIFIQHTSASLTVNENASPEVPLDLNDALDRLAPEGNYYRHDDEGSDDMPAHVKSSLMGVSLLLPISRGRLALGTWQGVYLNEHRNSGGPRTLLVTLQGQVRGDGRKYAPAGSAV